jgi:aminodeoxyfutalosine deaminase
MQFITADRIHNGNKWLPKGTTIEVAEDGRIVAFHSKPVEGARFYNGILTPGFINVHCHLELSHMKGVAKEGTGLIPFLKNIPQYRNNFSEEEKKEARHKAFEEMLANGIVAVGDIANTTDTLDLRSMDRIHFQTFVEALGFAETSSNKAFGYALNTYEVFAAQQPQTKQLLQAIVPHAPYSVSTSLFRLIDNHQPGTVLSIHNQESEEENRFFINKEGAIRELLQALGIDDSHFRPTGKPSLESYLQHLSHTRPYIFVHNTYTDINDIDFACAYAGETYWCLCPNANLFIESRLPDIDTFVNEGLNICIGSDSLASNHKLSVLSELETIKKHYPHISWETLIKWGTSNGADALQMHNIAGSLEVGKTPGILLLKGIDEADENASVERLF